MKSHANRTESSLANSARSRGRLLNRSVGTILLTASLQVQQHRIDIITTTPWSQIIQEYSSNHDIEDQSEACESCDLQSSPNLDPDSSVQIFRQASQLPQRSVSHVFSKPQSIRLTPASYRLLSTETRAAIEKAIETKPVVLFMKGTPETPQCGFSRASIQILGLQGVDPDKFAAFNVLENEELRQGELQTALGRAAADIDAE